MREPTIRQAEKAITEVCENCGNEDVFEYLGEQRWPERVAAALGIDPVVSVWRCRHCHTTITHHR
ncbi:MAG: hypothetical protein OHK0046_22700 [Anaerolineae bacterium]